MTPKVPPSSRFRLLGPLELAILGLFFLSGASALVYEVVWSRTLSNIFGASAFAVATVLAAFMAGLALGSTVFGRAIDRRGHPLVVYGILEAAIAVWALMLPLLFLLLDKVFAEIYRAGDPGFYSLSLIRFALTFLVLLVPTTMMGGTLPVLGKLLLRDRKRLGQRAGILYGANTLGAVVGVAAGGFVLLPALGLRGSTILAAVVNLLVAAAAILLARKFRTLPAEEKTPAPRPDAPAGPRPALHRVVLIVYAASGFAALAYEVAWTKTLSMTLGNTTYAFTSMLTTFLLGLALGAFIFARLADRYGRPEILLALVQIGIPVTALAMIPVFGNLPQYFADGFNSFNSSWAKVELFRFLLAAMTMILPTILMGGTFPLVTRIYVEGGRTGRQLGSLYAANTVGAIFGSFLAGFVLIPWIGRQNSVLAASLVNLAAAGLLIPFIRWRGVSLIPRLATAVLALLLVPASIVGFRPWDPALMVSGAYVYVTHMGPAGYDVKEFMAQNKLVFYDEGTEATVSVWNTEFVYSLRTNGKIEASSHGDMITQKMISHLPILYHQGEPKEALMIGLASGISTGVILTHPLDRLETIEIIPSMEQACRYFDAYNYQCLDDPRHELILNDGRNYLLLTDKTYDVIVSEPPNPWVAGITALFTREFFEITKARLNPGGIVCQWVQTYQLNENDIRTVLATFVDAYPYLHLWRGGPGDMIVVASMEPLVFDLDRLDRALEGPPGDDLRDLEILPLPHMLSLFVTDKPGIEAFVGSWPKRVTDDNLYLEYSVPRNLIQRGDEIKSEFLNRLTTSVIPHLTGETYPALETEIENYRRARTMAYDVRNNRAAGGGQAREETLRNALILAPHELMARTFLSHAINEAGIQQLVAGNIAASIPHFQEAIQIGISQERALANNNLGAIAYSEGKLDTALYHWQRAIAEEPNYPVVIMNLAMLSASMGDTAGAVAHLRRAAYLQPHDPSVLNTLAYYLAEVNSDLEEALSLSRRAVAKEPSSIYLDTFAYVLVRLGRWEEAETILRKILDEDPAALESLLHLGMAQAGSGRSEQARRSFERVIRQAPDTPLAERARYEMKKL